MINEESCYEESEQSDPNEPYDYKKSSWYQKLSPKEKMENALQEQASKIIAEKMAMAAQIIRECEKLAMECDVSFRNDISYGMGGTFNPESGIWESSSSNC